MQIVCPSCEAWYDVAETAVGQGRTVRCARCRTVWTATAADAEAAARRAAAARAAAPSPATASASAGGAATAVMPPPEPIPEPPAAAAEDDEPSWDSALAEQADKDAAATLDDAPPTAPDPDDGEAADAPAEKPQDWDAAFEAAEARRLAREQTRKKPEPKADLVAKIRAALRPSWLNVVLSLLVVIGAILAWRADVVRAMPQTASLFAGIGLPVNLRGLAFDDIKVEREASDGVPVVVIEGEIVNITKGRIEVPRLRFALRDAGGAEVYTWTALPVKTALAPGEAQPFKTRLASPPPEASELTLRFFTRRDR